MRSPRHDLLRRWSNRCWWTLLPPRGRSKGRVTGPSPIRGCGALEATICSMPAALAVSPRDGRVFIASMKMGEVFVLRDPSGDGKSTRYDNYGRGLFQEAYSLLAENDALYVLHRRNLTRIVGKAGGLAERLDRVAGLAHGSRRHLRLRLRPGARPRGRLRLDLRPLRQPEPARLRRRGPLDSRTAAARDRLWLPQSVRLVPGPGEGGFLHRQPGRLGGHEQALLPGRGPLPRLPKPRAEAAPGEAGRQARGVGPLRAGPGRSTAWPSTRPAASSGRSRGNSSWRN